jgi:hypothetical protein
MCALYGIQVITSLHYPYPKVSYEVQHDIIALYGLGLHDLIPMHGD